MMKNKRLGLVLQIIGWVTIVESGWSFTSSILANIELTKTFLDVFVLFLTYLVNFPFLFIGVFFVWLGKRLNINDPKAEEDENNSTKNPTAKGRKTFGWIVVLIGAIFTLLGFMITNDAESQAYRPLLVIPPAIGIVVGLFIVWTGMRIQKNTNI